MCVIFANSLLGTTIQDGSKSKRSNALSLISFLFFSLFPYSLVFSFSFVDLAKEYDTKSHVTEA